MILNPSSNSAQIVTSYCLITFFSIPILITSLYYSGYLLEIGQYSCIYFIGILSILELVKYYFSLFYYDTFKSKSKKNCLKFKEIFKCLYILSGSTAILYTISVLFGAPVVGEFEETIMFSILVTSLTILPCCIHLGSDSTVSLISGSKQLNNSVADLLLKNLRLTIFGAWLGAVLIPLDWERPWQNWPIPCSFGALLGYFCSHFVVLMQGVPVPHCISKYFAVKM